MSQSAFFDRCSVWACCGPVQLRCLLCPALVTPVVVHHSFRRQSGHTPVVVVAETSAETVTVVLAHGLGRAVVGEGRCEGRIRLPNQLHLEELPTGGMRS